jgi:hypothetical protein
MNRHSPAIRNCGQCELSVDAHLTKLIPRMVGGHCIGCPHQRMDWRKGKRFGGEMFSRTIPSFPRASGTPPVGPFPSLVIPLRNSVIPPRNSVIPAQAGTQKYTLVSPLSSRLCG